VLWEKGGVSQNSRFRNEWESQKRRDTVGELRKAVN
jgi:hypothetical protein